MLHILQFGDAASPAGDMDVSAGDVNVSAEHVGVSAGYVASPAEDVNTSAADEHLLWELCSHLQTSGYVTLLQKIRLIKYLFLT